MAWQIVHGPLAVHIAPKTDIAPHEYDSPCWCGAHVDYPNSDRVLHYSFLEDEEIGDEPTPDHQMIEQ